VNSQENMLKTIVLVLMAKEDADAQAFREAIEADPKLRERVELRFGKEEDAMRQAPEAEIVVCGALPPALLEAATQLRWVSFYSAGLDGKITPELAARNLKLTNASGVHGPNIAEHVMAFMLMFTRRMPFHLRAQVEGKWDRPPGSRSIGADELTGKTLGIVGLGRIGEALTIRAKAFGMRVVATKRDPGKRYEADIVPDALYPQTELPQLLAESDHVCVAVPYTSDTHHLLDAPMLAHIKPGAYLYNIARGKIIDETALIAALQSGALAGAGLDVFEIEPLPADSPLWQMENVIITPHTSGITPYYFARAAEIFADNLHRYLDNELLHNLYDPQRGY